MLLERLPMSSVRTLEVQHFKSTSFKRTSPSMPFFSTLSIHIVGYFFVDWVFISVNKWIYEAGFCGNEVPIYHWSGMLGLVSSLVKESQNTCIRRCFSAYLNTCTFSLEGSIGFNRSDPVVKNIKRTKKLNYSELNVIDCYMRLTANPPWLLTNTLTWWLVSRGPPPLCRVFIYQVP